MKHTVLHILCTGSLLLCALLGIIACTPSDEPASTTESDTLTAEPATQPVTDATQPADTAPLPDTAEVSETVTEPVTEPETLAGAEQLAEILRSSDSLRAQAKQIGLVRHDGVSHISQGGYTDGTYHYQLHIKKDTASNEENNIVRLVKYDIAEETIVQISEPLPLNHANDLTYNPKRNVFLAVHNNPHREWVSVIDPETLSVIETVTIDFRIYSIDYNEARDRYVVGLSGGQTFRFLDADLKPVSDEVYEPTPLTIGYTTQGVACDDSFIYFVLWQKNVITVYDWDGRFVTLISLASIQEEPENISVIDGEIYIGVGTGAGTALYRIVRYK